MDVIVRAKISLRTSAYLA